MDVREEHLGQGKRDAVAHHLALRALAAVEQQCFPLAGDRNGADPTLDSGAGGGGAKKTDEKRHGPNIDRSDRRAGTGRGMPLL